MTELDGSHTIQKGLLRVCCAKPENLGPLTRLTANLCVRICRECGNRHFEGEAPPIHLGLTGTRLGG